MKNVSHFNITIIHFSLLALNISIRFKKKKTKKLLPSLRFEPPKFWTLEVSGEWGKGGRGLERLAFVYKESLQTIQLSLTSSKKRERIQRWSNSRWNVFLTLTFLTFCLPDPVGKTTQNHRSSPHEGFFICILRILFICPILSNWTF